MATLEQATKILALTNIKEIDMANKFAGIIEEKSAKPNNDSTLFQLKIGGKTYSAYANSVSSDTVAVLEAVNQGDEVEGEYIEKPGTNRFNKPIVYRNISSLVKVDRIGQPANRPAGRNSGDPNKDRGVALRYAVDMVIAGKIELGQVYSQADDFLAYITGATGEDGQGEF